MLVETKLEYRAGDPVVVRVHRHDGRTRVSDGAAAAEKAGYAKVPEDVARQIYEEFVVNVSRRGEIFLPGERFVDRIARASVALYQELLDLD